MINAANPRITKLIVDRTVEEAVWRAMGVWESITGPDGETWSDIPLEGGEFVAYYMDLAGRGVIGHLEVIDQAVGSNHADSLRREFDRQFAKGIE